jgi:hypothetical protein
MPNSWQKLERLSEDEEHNFIQENINYLLSSERNRDNVDEELYFSIYRQQAGTDTFYRVIETASNTPDFMSRSIRFDLALIHQNTYLGGVRYNITHATQSGWVTFFQSIDIIESGGKAKGILYTQVGVSVDDENDWRQNNEPLNQPLSGGSSSKYFLMENLLNKNLSERELGKTVIRITASACHIDPDCPLRYSFQNAFDGNPATAYVISNEVDLMKIDLLYTNFEEINQIAIINGYAQNKDVYAMYNRVKEISAITYHVNEDQTKYIETTLGSWYSEDNNLNYQMFSIRAPAIIYINKVFNGTVYDYTAISELNFLTDNGWLFGDIFE